MNCSLNKNHLICKKPVEIKCGENQTYIACYECVYKQTDYSGLFKCKFCPKDHRINSLETKKFQSSNRLELQNILRQLVDKGNLINSSLKDKLDANYRLNLLINSRENIKQNFLIRIETFNFELDNLNDKLFKKIDQYKYRELDNGNETRKIFKSFLLEDKNISNHIFINQKCKLYEQNFKFLSQFVNIKPLNFKFRDKIFDSSRRTPTKSLLGFIQGPFSTLTIKKNINLVPTIKIADLSCFIKSSCGLAEINNGKKVYLAMTDYAANDIKILSKYDSYCLTEIDIISRENFLLKKYKCYYAICSNFDSNQTYSDEEYQNLYVCDMELHRIVIFDQNVTKIRRIISHVPGNEKEEFECLRDICYYDEFIYVLDQGKNVINIFHKNGDFYKNFYFNKSEDIVKNPWSIRTGHDRILIIDWKNKVLVYDFEFNLINSIQIDSVLSMCLINDYDGRELNAFFHCENGRLCGYRIGCQDAKYNLIFDRYFKQLKYRSEFFIFTSSQHFVLSLGWNKSLAIIDFA